MIKYKFEVMKALSDAGYNSARLRRDKILGQGTIQNIRQGKPISMDAINSICCMLRCQPGDLLEVTPSDEEKIKFF